MSASDRVLGRAEAVLTIVEDRAGDIARLTEAVTALERRVNSVVPEVEQLRDIVPDLRATVAGLKRTTWMTSVQLAKHLHVHRDTIDRWARDGVIPSHRVDEGHYRFDASEVDRKIRREEFRHELARLQ